MEGFVIFLAILAAAVSLVSVLHWIVCLYAERDELKRRLEWANKDIEFYKGIVAHRDATIRKIKDIATKG